MVARLLLRLRGTVLGLLLGIVLGAAAARRRARRVEAATAGTALGAQTTGDAGGGSSAQCQRHQQLCRTVVGGGGRIHEAYSVAPIPEYGGCDGVVAAVDVAEGTIVVDLPLSQCLVSAAPEGDGLAGGSSAGVRLVRVLLHHMGRGEASPHVTYLESLPRAFSEPTFWAAGSEEMAALSGSRLADSIVAAQQEAEQAAGALVSELQRQHVGKENPAATVTNVLWAKKVQVTRAFELDVMGSDGPQEQEREEDEEFRDSSCFIVMAPLIDLANHSSDPAAVNAHFSWSCSAPAPSASASKAATAGTEDEEQQDDEEEAAGAANERGRGEANESQGQPRPSSREMLDDMNIRLQMVASRDIRAGEQIQLDYDHTASPLGLFHRYGIPPSPLDIAAAATGATAGAGATAAGAGADEVSGQSAAGMAAESEATAAVAEQQQQQVIERRRHEVAVAFPAVLRAPFHPMWKVKLLARCYYRHTPWLPSHTDREMRRATAWSAAERRRERRARWQLQRLSSRTCGESGEDDGDEEGVCTGGGDVGGMDAEADAVLDEWAWACEEGEDLHVESDGYGFLLMDLLRIVALDSQPSPRPQEHFYRADADDEDEDEDEDEDDDGGGDIDDGEDDGVAVDARDDDELLEPPTAWEDTIALALLADVIRSQLQSYRRYTVPAAAATTTTTAAAGAVPRPVGGEGGDACWQAEESHQQQQQQQQQQRVIMARQAVEYERTLLLRKLGEIERALQDITAVQLHSNRVATAEATVAIRQRRAATRRRQALRPAAAAAAGHADANALQQAESSAAGCP
eukprot:COSAG06_NODE_3890_length_4801_cov_2.569545_3_plen_802_part_00